MDKHYTLEQTYDRCTIDGYIVAHDSLDIRKADSFFEMAIGDLQVIENLKEKGDLWSSIFRLQYQAFCNLARASMWLDNMTTENDQALFAYLCLKHPELDLDWGFFEKVRVKNEALQSNDQPMHNKEWKSIELQAMLYINAIKRHIEERIN
ncbi:hypothetical protein COT47_06590 [Candidatus Woesearchaeota archaeon CG08_land_8_20_14_0_20_43_7]|nr:MAG: hypothetical protein COT47_06590 [Candidatus Woesearchaeota archaeon CG08_land_8_20_14_0_20_43_7]